VSADNCYLRNSQMGESWRIPHCLCAFQAYAKFTFEITLVKWRLQTADIFHQHTHALCNQLFTADMPPVFSSHCLHDLSTTCKISTTPLHTRWYRTIPCVVSLSARKRKDQGHAFDRQTFLTKVLFLKGYKPILCSGSVQVT